jgi:hypothetical protein
MVEPLNKIRAGLQDRDPDQAILPSTARAVRKGELSGNYAGTIIAVNFSASPVLPVVL